MHAGWTGCLALRCKLSIDESGRECIGLGDAVSFIDCAGRLTELAYNYSEFVFDFE